MHIEFHGHAGETEGAQVLQNVIEVFPYCIHTLLTDNGPAFADLPKNRNGVTLRLLGVHIFDRVYILNGIEHQLTKPYHPWTNGQPEWMVQTIEDATINAYHHNGQCGLRAHVQAFVTTYNFAKHITSKTLKWLTPYQAICRAWESKLKLFKMNQHHLILGPDT